jgi:NtrC-family two-component system sensor histidine kinase KinB
VRSIATSIGLSYLALTALAAAIGVFSMLRFSDLGGSVGRILEENYRSVRAAEGMVQALERQEAARLHARAGEAEAVTGGAAMPGGPVLLDSIRVYYDAYVVAADAAFDAVGQARSRSAEEEAVPPAVARLRAWISRLLDVNQRAMLVTRERVEEAEREAVRAVVFATLCAVVAGGLLGVRFSRRLTLPLRRLAEAVGRVRAGRPRETVEVETNDEVGELALAFNAMTERLRHYDAMNVEALVAEQRKQERLVEAMPSPVVVTDEGGRVALLNEAAGRLLGAPPEGGTWVGRPLADAAFALAALLDADGPADASADAELLELPLDGAPRVFRPRQTDVPTAEGAYTITLLEDVTPFRDLDRARRDFLAAVSHELRTPLTSLGVALDLLLRDLVGPLAPEQRDLVETAKADQERLKGLVGGLLDLARLEAGAAPPAPTRLGLAALLADVVAGFRLPADQRGVALTLDVPPDLPPAYGDPRQLGWVAANLVGNALRHAPDGGGVAVRAWADGDGVRVAVEDDGPGVPAEAAGAIFEPFVQAGGDTRPGGAGLGLAIAKRVVEAHGGRIWAEPRSTGGFFAFTLPAPRPDPTPGDGAPARA